MNQVRVGVIGVGRMGQRHCRIYSTLRQAQLAGVCDAALEIGRRVATEYAVPFYECVDDLLKHVDAVSLAVPTPAHFPLAMRCLDRGVHIFIEKPITETIEEAEALTQAVESSGLIVQVGYIERFNPTYIELRNVLEELTPLAVNFRRLSPYVGSNTDVDVVLDLMTHDIDLALDLVGEGPSSMNGYGLTVFSGHIDHAVAYLCFPSGPFLTLAASRATEQKVRLIEITAAEAYVEADLLNKSILIHRHTIGEYLNHNHRGVKYRQESIVERIHIPIFEPLFLELQHFVECILQGKTPRVSARDGLNAMRLTLAIRNIIRKHMLDMTQQSRSLRHKTVEHIPAVY